MKALLKIATILAIFGITYGEIVSTIPRYNKRTPQHLRYRMSSANNNNNRIVGGIPSDIADHPHTLVLLDNGGFICGASAISKLFALSAAHCLEFNSPPSQINLRGGSTNRISGGILFFVESYILHPQYDNTNLDFDIALLRVQDNSPLEGLNVVPITISPACYKPCCHTCDDGDVTIKGWGFNEHGYAPYLLNEITLPIFNHVECDRIWWYVGPMSFCVFAGNGMDSCVGDSGTPLSRKIDGKTYQLGVVNFGSFHCGDGSVPSVNARIEYPPIRNWIQQVSGI